MPDYVLMSRFAACFCVAFFAVSACGATVKSETANPLGRVTLGCMTFLVCVLALAALFN